MKRATILLAVLVFVAAGCGGNLVGPEVKTATRGTVGAVMVRSGPAIDGTMECPRWKLCPELKLGKTESEEIGELKSVARVLFDSKNMYVGFMCEEKNTGALVADGAVQDDPVWQDDCVEIFVAPDINKGYYQIVVNSKGVVMDAHSSAGADGDSAWDSQAVVKASVQKDKCWIVTLAIPLKGLGAKSGENQTWTLNLNRSKPLGDNNFVESTWSAKGRSSYHDSSGWGKVTGLNVP